MVLLPWLRLMGGQKIRRALARAKITFTLPTYVCYLYAFVLVVLVLTISVIFLTF